MHPQVAVAGYVCLDVIPTFEGQTESLASLFQPGQLAGVGPAVTAPGGAVSNTGLALHRLGIPVKLVGKVGADLFAQELRKQYGQYDEELAAGIITSPKEVTSYTIVISPPGVDRFFLHCTGANNSFRADDVDFAQLDGVRIFHFGYPPLMRSMYENGGAELALIMQRAKAAGLTTSLDMALPDPSSEAARVEWPALLAHVLPHVDIFLPSLEEVQLMLGTFSSQEESADGRYLKQASTQLLAMGTAVVVIKLGDQGLYLRTTSASDRLSAMGAAAPQETATWLDRELLAPSFQAQLVGTTGAGDCAIAGFLAGLLKGLTVEEVLVSATAVGACNVEGPDATSSIPEWDTVRGRIQAGWKQHAPRLSLPGWRQENLIWIGPDDGQL
jgi:sugar/nucleoside kinase (ribokinase family)